MTEKLKQKNELEPEMIWPSKVIPLGLIGMVQYYSRYLILASRHPDSKYEYLGEGIQWSGDDYNDLRIKSTDIVEFVKRYVKNQNWSVFADGTSIEDGIKLIEENINKNHS